MTCANRCACFISSRQLLFDHYEIAGRTKMTLALPFVRLPALPGNIAENQKLKIGAKKAAMPLHAAFLWALGAISSKRLICGTAVTLG